MLKYVFTFAILAALMAACTPDNTSTNSLTSEKKNVVQTEERIISLELLISLFDHLADKKFIESEVKNYGFKKKFEGIYISKRELEPNEPIHWIYITNMGTLSSVSLSTADELTYKRLLGQLTDYDGPKSFDDGTKDIANKYIGKDYTIKTFVPKNGINLKLNNLYQIFVVKTKTE